MEELARHAGNLLRGDRVETMTLEGRFAEQTTINGAGSFRTHDAVFPNHRNKLHLLGTGSAHLTQSARGRYIDIEELESVEAEKSATVPHIHSESPVPEVDPYDSDVEDEEDGEDCNRDLLHSTRIRFKCDPDYYLFCACRIDDLDSLSSELENSWGKLAHPLLKFGAHITLREVHSRYPERFTKSLLALSAMCSPTDTFKLVASLTKAECDGLILCSAALGNNLELVNYLLDIGCPSDARSIGYSASEGNLEMVRLLVSRGIVPNYVSLCNASQMGQVEVLQCMLGAFDRDELTTHLRKFVVAGACSMYTTECLVLLNTALQAISRDALQNCMRSGNASALAYCMWTDPTVELDEDVLQAAYRSRSVMGLFLAHLERGIKVPAGDWKNACRQGSVTGLVHHLLTWGNIDLSRCTKACRYYLKTWSGGGGGGAADPFRLAECIDWLTKVHAKLADTELHVFELSGMGE